LQSVCSLTYAIESRTGSVLAGDCCAFTTDMSALADVICAHADIKASTFWMDVI
jgi:hypothetical protein